MDIPRTTQVVSAIAHTAYGIGFKEAANDFRSPFAFDAYDLWFGADFDYVINSLLEDFLSDIETDISSVDSSNLSEQASEQRSQQSSADNQARFDAGLDPVLAESESASGESASRVSTPPASTNNNTTQSSSATSMSMDTSATHSHPHHGWAHSAGESTFSGVSWSDDGERTGLSHSEGTSQDTGEASTLSSVSILIQEYNDFWANANEGAAVTILDAEDDSGKHHGSGAKNPKDNGFGGLGGVEWIGDDDNENLFGTGWLDEIFGGKGADDIRGLGGDDYITGGDGVDKIWGDAGDDRIYTSYGTGELDESNDPLVAMAGDGDFASGGSGDDFIYG